MMDIPVRKSRSIASASLSCKEQTFMVEIVMQASRSAGLMSLRAPGARRDMLRPGRNRAFSLRTQGTDKIGGSCWSDIALSRLMKAVTYSSAIALAFYPSFSLEAQIIPPEVKIVDDRNINILTRQVSFSENLISSPTGNSEDLSFSRHLFIGNRWFDNSSYRLFITGLATMNVVLGDRTHIFNHHYGYIDDGNQWTGDRAGNNFRETIIGGKHFFEYVSRDGLKVLFDVSMPTGPANAAIAAVSAEFPSGVFRSFHYKPSSDGSSFRLQSIVQNDGTQLKFTYSSNDSSSSYWTTLTSVSLLNQAYVYCNPIADQCGFSVNDWPTVSFFGPASGVAPAGQTAIDYTVTNTGYGRSYKKDMYGRVIGVSNLHAYNEILTLSYDGIYYNINNVANDQGEITSYITGYSADNSIKTMDISSSFLGSENYKLDNHYHFLPIEYTDRNGGKTTYVRTLLEGQITKITYPEGNYESFERDSRFNVKAKITSPKPGSGQTSITETVAYPSTCTNPSTCNLPTSYVDGKGNMTDWVYTSFGQTQSEMGPAPTPGAARPLKLYTYIQKQAYILNSSGSLVPTGKPIWLLNSETICQTVMGSNTPVCDTGAPQTVSTFIYGANATENNLLPKGKQTSSGGETLLTCYRYDRWRRKISETKPAANLTACP